MGYFTVFYHFHLLLLLASLLVQVPTPPFVTISALPVSDPYFLAHPFRHPSLPFFVIVAIFVRHVLWCCMCETLSYKLLTKQAFFWISILCGRFPTGAPRFSRPASTSWLRTTRRRRRRSAALSLFPLLLLLILLLASHSSVPAPLRRTLTV